MQVSGVGALYAVAGLATLAAALLPRVLRRLPVSMPMVFLAAGIAGFALIPSLPDPDPRVHGAVAVHLTELCVVVSLMGAGLALNRPISWRTWSSTWRLLAIAMTLSMVAVGILGWFVLGLGAASAVLLAAVLAPTDPVLASEVQVSEPVTEPGAADDEARFALTSEAGLNDGLAFPFTYAAIAVSLAGISPGRWLLHWALVDVLWRLGVGVLVGLTVGWLLGKLFFSAVPEPLRLSEKSDGFVALAATFIAYGAAELAQGYGFIAVFVCACTIRLAEREHGYHGVLHTFVEQIERVLTVVVIVFLGGAVSRGLLAGTGWGEVAFALAILFVVRPICGWIALTPGKTGPGERAVIAFFGVRGVGSLYYIAYALEHGAFPSGQRLWSIVALVVIGSLVIHGVAATPAMTALDARRARESERHGGPDIATTPA